MMNNLLLFAQQATSTSREVFEFGRFPRLEHNLALPLAIGVVVVMAILSWLLYRRDAIELPKFVCWIFLFFRVSVYVGLLLIYLQPQWTVRTTDVINSRVVILGDKTRSMTIPDETDELARKISRNEAMVQQLTKDDMKVIQSLQEKHDVILEAFGSSLSHTRLVLNKNQTESKASVDDQGATDEEGQEEAPKNPADSKNLANEIAKLYDPVAPETKIGRSLQQSVVSASQNKSTAGLILIADGRNATDDPIRNAASAARNANIPVFVFSVGSSQLQKSVRAQNLEVPPRVYPGEDVVAKGFLSGIEMEGQTVGCTLTVKNKTTGENTFSAASQVAMGEDDEIANLDFQIPTQPVGEYAITFEVDGPQGDDPEDNKITVDFEVCDRKMQVLLVAGGPMREYRFLRTLLYRDKSVELHTLLQSAPEGAVQEGKTLSEFPATMEELNKYDCIVAFDPDFNKLDPDGDSQVNKERAELLQRWVSQEMGGFALVGGPVYCGAAIGPWILNPDLKAVQNLMPVEFEPPTTALIDSTHIAEEPVPLELTRAGYAADYLKIYEGAGEIGADVNDPTANKTWKEMPGVYSFLKIRRIKPTAQVLAYYNSREFYDADGHGPAYMVAQRYGGGRTFFIASGEMWRTRMINTCYFARFYTKLLRHLSAARLLRDSKRGTFLIAHENFNLGETVDIRAELKDQAFEPLKSPKEIKVRVYYSRSATSANEGAKSQRVPLLLTSDPGTYKGLFTPTKPGRYDIQLEIPDSDDEVLKATIFVKAVDQELAETRNDEKLLREIATLANTRGKGANAKDVNDFFFEDIKSLGDVVGLLEDRTQINPRTKVPDFWSQPWLPWAAILLCGLLFLEWILRRLLKLA